MKDVDDRLLQIKLPSEIKRLPRSLSETLKYWKASELRSFLLYYGVPVLIGILPPVLLQHYMLLVYATFILLKDGSTAEELKQAESCLLQFVEFFVTLYGVRYATLNIHQLIHLVDDALNLGPLYTHDCFYLEDKNRETLNFIHGTQNIDTQITTGISFIQKIPELINDCIEPGTVFEKLVNSLRSGYSPKHKEELFNEVHRLGAKCRRLMSNEEFVAVCDSLQFTPPSIVAIFFKRIALKNMYIYGTDYKRMLSRTNAVVKLYPNQRQIIFAEICRFVHFKTDDQDHFLCLGHALIPCKEYNGSCHITQVEKKGHISCLSNRTHSEKHCVRSVEN